MAVAWTGVGGKRLYLTKIFGTKCHTGRYVSGRNVIQSYLPLHFETFSHKSWLSGEKSVSYVGDLRLGDLGGKHNIQYCALLIKGA